MVIWFTFTFILLFFVILDVLIWPFSDKLIHEMINRIKLFKHGKIEKDKSFIVNLHEPSLKKKRDSRILQQDIKVLET